MASIMRSSSLKTCRNTRARARRLSRYTAACCVRDRRRVDGGGGLTVNRQKKGDTNMKLAKGTTLREENTDRKEIDVNSILRMEHLQKIATWAAVDAGIAPLGALFGHRLATCAEDEGVPVDPSTLNCKKCESNLQPGFNCTARIKKVANKSKRMKKSEIYSAKNNVVYKCHFCSHLNMKRGTQKGYMKTVSHSKQNPEEDWNKSKSAECSNTSASSKRKRKGWSSLKKIVENNEAQSRSVSNFAIPFTLNLAK